MNIDPASAIPAITRIISMRSKIRRCAPAPAMIFFVLLGASLLVGCVDSQGERWKEAMKQANQIAEACVEKRLKGELPGYVAGHRCAESRVRRVLAESGWPHMDLVNLWLAYDLAMSRRIDDGKISEEDGEVQFAELMTRITNEIERRDLAKMQARAQWLQSYGMLLQGLGTWQRSLNPPAPIHGDLITCTQMIRTITCY